MGLVCWIDGHHWLYRTRSDMSEYRICNWCEKYENLYKGRNK